MSSGTVQNTDQPARKQQQRSRATKSKLLGAAIEAFSENGFNGTSTRDIAERAGVHHPLITYHFKSKERLWHAAADKIFREFRKALATAARSVDEDCPKQRMASLIRTYVRYVRSQPALHGILMQEASYPNARLEWLIESHLQLFYETTSGMIEELQRLGVAPAGNPKLLLNMMRLSSSGLFALENELEASSNIDVNSPETLNEISDMIIRVFLPGEVPPASPG